MFRLQTWFGIRRMPTFVATLIFCALQPQSTAQAQDSTRVPTVMMLKRIAEAVHGSRIDGSVFAVTNVDSMNVTAVMRSRDDAMALINRLGSRYSIHGPFRPDPDGPIPGILPPDCVHHGLSAWQPRGFCPPEVLSNLSGISLVLTRRDGTTRTISLPPGTDAVFLSLPAMDKLVFPYYARIIGLEATTAWRTRMVEQMRRP